MPMLDLCSITTGKLDSNASVAGGEFPFFTCAPETFRINSFAFDTEAVLLGGNNASGIFPVKYYFGKFNAYQRTYVIQTKKPSLLITRFLFFALQLQIARLQNLSTGAATKFLTMGILKHIQIPTPRLSQQVKIVECLSAYDDLIETNRRRIALLEESARLLYREWFVNLRFPGYQQSKMVDGLPVGWCRQPLSAMIEENPKTSFEKGKTYPFVPMQSLSEFSMVISAREEREISGGAKFQNLDTLLARITPCLENGKTGFVQFLDDELPVASGSTEFIVMRSKSVSPYWVYCLCREDSFREHAIRSMAGADGRQRVKPQCFDTYMTLQPPASILLEFDRIMEPLFSEVELLAKQNVLLQEGRDALLPKLMSGAIQV